MSVSIVLLLLLFWGRRRIHVNSIRSVVGVARGERKVEEMMGFL